MSQDSSLVGAFDLNSQTGVMSVLASIRASGLSPSEKNELRDLVFLYTNGGGDASVRIALEQKLTTYQIAPVAVRQSASAGPTLSFGSQRPVPTFKAPRVDVPKPVVTPVAEPVVGNMVSPAPVVTPVVAPVVTPPPVEMTPPLVSPVAPAEPAPRPAPVMTPPVVVRSAPVVAPVTPPAPPTPPPVAPRPAPTVAPEESAYLERIRQIKTAVNSKVGNPVNLVDIDNEAGREYMNALLEAMKKLSSGAVSEMGPAMQRLEKAFATVEVAIAEHAKAEAVAASVPPTPVIETPPTPPAPPAPPEPIAPAPLPPRPPRPVAPPVTVPPPPTEPAPVPPPVPVMQKPIVPEPLPVRPTAFPPPVIEPEPVPTISEVSGYDQVQAPEVAVPPTPVAPLPPIPPIPPNPFSAPVPTPPVAPLPPRPTASSMPVPPAPVDSLAQRQPIRTIEDLPDPASLETSVGGGDPLSTREIDDGLNQLLSDWSLFKKSGLFGTGPKGREHPLFKKIADLPVPLLLAGRFDGSTQEIRQSITDYMNGWRYEQGIIYQPGETFERYLRRVIRHILDLQKKRKNA